jgi:hypothetical protein
MYHVRQENLPFVGSSHEFVGSEQGDTAVSVFLFHGKPGSGPGPHRHPFTSIHASFKRTCRVGAETGLKTRHFLNDDFHAGESFFFRLRRSREVPCSGRSLDRYDSAETPGKKRKRKSRSEKHGSEDPPLQRTRCYELDFSRHSAQ